MNKGKPVGVDRNGWIAYEGGEYEKHGCHPAVVLLAARFAHIAQAVFLTCWHIRKGHVFQRWYWKSLLTAR
jgi:hypothetical protein